MIEACLVTYAQPGKGYVKPAPPIVLRSLGFRDQTCWIVPAERLEMIPVGNWRDAGMDVHVWRIDAAEGERVVDTARATFSRELSETIAELEGGPADLRKRLAKLKPGAKSEWRVVKGIAYRQVRRGKVVADSIEKAAPGFGLGDALGGLIEELRVLVRDRGEQYFTMVEAARDAVFGRRTLGGAA